MKHLQFRTMFATTAVAAMLAAAPSFAMDPQIEQLQTTLEQQLTSMDISTDHLMQASLSDLVRITEALEKGDSQARLKIGHILGNDGPHMMNMAVLDGTGGRSQLEDAVVADAARVGVTIDDPGDITLNELVQLKAMFDRPGTDPTAEQVQTVIGM